MRDLHFPGRSPVIAQNGMVATSHPLAANAALDVMKAGGNAMDAALAGAVLLGICEPQMTGIGGDLFALWSPAGSNEVKALNGSGRAPAGMDVGDLREKYEALIPATSPHAVTIPGAVDAICTLADNEGRIGLDRVLAPAIHYAREGVPVASRVARDWQFETANLQGVAKDFYLLNGRVPVAGEVFRAPAQAEVLEKIAREGRDAFYTGEVAEDILTALNSLGGIHTAEDFASAKSDPTNPISVVYDGVEVLEHPPNGQGATALLILNILSHFDLASMDPFGSTRAHVEAEATKLAYGLRNQTIADAAFADLDPMISSQTAADLAAKIDLTRAGPETRKPEGRPHKDTVYITAVDRDGMAVSLIYSIFDTFGTGIASPKFGILLHNRGSGFTLAEGNANEAGPGKRPLHTIIPGMTRRDGIVEMPFGVMGGQYQAAGHARLITNMVNFGMDPQVAIDGPRAFAEKGILKVERSYSEKVHRELADLGHEIEIPHKPVGGAQAIQINQRTGTLIGGSDPRKDGCAIGY